MGRKRRAQFSSRNFSTTATLVKRMAALKPLPSYHAWAWRDLLGLAVAELLLDAPRFEVLLRWTATADLDPGLSWLRSIAAELWMRGDHPPAHAVA